MISSVQISAPPRNGTATKGQDMSPGIVHEPGYTGPDAFEFTVSGTTEVARRLPSCACRSRSNDRALLTWILFRRHNRAPHRRRIQEGFMRAAILFGVVLTTAGLGVALAETSPAVLAQADIRIPTDADLERMERRSMATPPLSVGDAPALRGSEKSQDLEMDRQDVIVDRKVMRGICADCK
jgi:hypothetical protein